MTDPTQGALVFRAGSQPVDTSEDAADSLAADYLDKLRRSVLELFERRGPIGATADEVAVYFRCDHNHTSPRVTELAGIKLIERTRVRRKTRKGRGAGVYEITSHGLRALAAWRAQERAR